jgi:uncharacterized protein YprB with RNaseH-like and TPR domain
MKTPKRLFFDVETSPNIGLFWKSGYKLSIDHGNIINERAIICIAWKWSGQKTVYSLTWDAKQNDRAMLKRFAKELEKADEAVGHNGDNFDIKWVRTRCLTHGIPLSPTFVTQDTLKLARSKFYFNSNRLDYIADFLGYGKKKPTGFQLWKDILLDKNKRAMKTMVDYCKHDVLLLEKVWDRFMPYVPAKSSIAEYISQCPECGSERTIINQRRVTAAGYKKITFVCKDCGKYHTVPQSRFAQDKLHQHLNK